MTDQTPNYLPWLRSGLAAQINTPAIDGLAHQASASLPVGVQLQADGATSISEHVPGPSVRLYGPAQVVGIDPAQIVRRSPTPGTTDAESNLFALLEFSAPDFPWRYTPAAAGEGLLQPWLVLVVVEDRPGISLETGGAGRLDVLYVDDPRGELPDLTQSWSWAHVQVDTGLEAGADLAYSAMPSAFRARLLCPRRLHARTAWIACLVPAFEAGRRAGLGESPAPEDAPAALLAWDAALAGGVTLPVYDSWRFQTGEAGDFESLVRRLQPRQMPSDLGLRDLDISQPGSGLPENPGQTISYQGALLAVTSQPKPWRDPPRKLFKAAMRRLLNQTLVRREPPTPYDALTDDPVVGPPAYTALQAQQRSVPAAGSPPIWFENLNTEPPNRSVAGLGAQVVRRDQETLMAKAWEFAAGARQANLLLNQARTAWELANRGRARLEGLPDEVFLQVAGPALGRLQYSSTLTLKGALRQSAMPGGLVSGAFRRLSHAVPGLRISSAQGIVPGMAAVTAAYQDHPQKLLEAWTASVQPAHADLEVVSAAPNQRLSSRAAASGGGLVDQSSSQTAASVPPAALSAKARKALDPAQAVANMVTRRITGLPPAANAPFPARLAVQPRFTTPMYRRLVALSVEYLVPGIGELPTDTLGLLQTNPPFVEAFLAGINHEMQREFLWREYPADPTDTWFQYFWYSSKDASADILPIKSWRSANSLGLNAPPGAPKASLVLLVRSVLLQRYPELRVYAVPAAWQAEDGLMVRRENLTANPSLPLFTARLSGDISIFAFDLTPLRARGSAAPATDKPGWFFVLEQPPAAPQFGLDVGHPGLAGKAPHNWQNLSWFHLAEPEGARPTFVDVRGPDWLTAAGPLPGNSDAAGKTGKDAWGEDAAAMARITFQRPVRMLVHADAMLP